MKYKEELIRTALGLFLMAIGYALGYIHGLNAGINEMWLMIYEIGEQDYFISI
jgi:hypothetical protein